MIVASRKMTGKKRSGRCRPRISARTFRRAFALVPTCGVKAIGKMHESGVGERSDAGTRKTPTIEV